MLKYLAIPVGAFLSASAQIVLKRSSGSRLFSTPMIVTFFLSAALYGLAMVVYLYLLREFPISRIYPTLTLLVILAVTVYGFLIGERLLARHLIGLSLSIAAVVLLLS
jgi:multidrug transporter EmrE-like cation transporter